MNPNFFPVLDKKFFEKNFVVDDYALIKWRKLFINPYLVISRLQLQSQGITFNFHFSFGFRIGQFADITDAGLCQRIRVNLNPTSAD